MTRTERRHAAFMAKGDELTIGRIGTMGASWVADEAARAIAGMDAPLAVTLSPRREVAIEAPEWAVPGEVVGVYRGTAIFTLSRLIYGDLREALRASA